MAMEGSGGNRRHSGRFRPDPLLEWAIAEQAGAQHGVVALRQLVALGLSASAVRTRVSAGRLHRVHDGVFAVGHAALTIEGHYMAAVLACGQGAVLSHREAAALLGLRASSRSVIDVTSPRRSGRERAGIEVHTGATLLPRDVDTVDGIPCTTVARTLLDLAEVVDRQQVERACEQAEVLRVFDLRAVEDVLDRANGRRGAPVLEAILAEHAIGTALTRRELEARFLALCRAAGLPRPEVNAWLPLEPIGVEADFLWREPRLIVETDGRATHLTARAFEVDRRRDQRAMLAGWRVVRFTWRQVDEEPAVVAATVSALLAQAA
jgi:hypothetical protein